MLSDLFTENAAEPHWTAPNQPQIDYAFFMH